MSTSAFKQAVEFIRNSPPKDSDIAITNKEKAAFYALYKQATVGPCSKHGGSQPSLIKFVARTKWDAWNALGDMTAEEAEEKYVKLVTETCANSKTHKFVVQ